MNVSFYYVSKIYFLPISLGYKNDYTRVRGKVCKTYSSVDLFNLSSQGLFLGFFNFPNFSDFLKIFLNFPKNIFWENLWKMGIFFAKIVPESSFSDLMFLHIYWMKNINFLRENDLNSQLNQLGTLMFKLQGLTILSKRIVHKMTNGFEIKV